MRIKKVEPSVGILGKIVNLFSSSKQDTYSCDYINSTIVDTLEGNETNKAPSVDAVNKGFAPFDYTSECTFSNCTFKKGAIYKIGKIVFVQIAFTATTTQEWADIVHIPSELAPLVIGVNDDSTRICGTDFWVYSSNIIRGGLEEGKSYYIVGAYLANN